MKIPGTIASAVKKISKYFYLLNTGGSSPFLLAYNYNTGGNLYGYLGNASSLPTNQNAGLVVNAQGTSVLTGGFNTPGIYGWPFSNSGFGSRYSSPSAPANWQTVQAFDINPASTYIALARQGQANRLYSYPFNTSSGFGTVSSETGGTTYAALYDGVKFSPSGTRVAVADALSGTTPAKVYNFGTTWGTQFSAPATSPTAILSGTAWSGTGNTVIFTSRNDSSNGYTFAYPFSGSGFGTLYSYPNAAYGCIFPAFTPSSDYIAKLDDINGSYWNINVLEFVEGQGYGSQVGSKNVSYENPLSFSFNPEGNAMIYTNQGGGSPKVFNFTPSAGSLGVQQQIPNEGANTFTFAAMR